MKNKFIIALSLFIAVVCTVFIFVGVISGNDSLEKQTGTEKNVPAHTESDGTQQPSVSDENSAENSSSSSSVNGGSDAQDTLGLKDSNINDDDNKSNSNNSSEPDVLGYSVAAVSQVSHLVPMEPLPVERVSFVACGDSLIHSSVYTDAQNLAAGTGKEYDFIPMFENVADIISEADLAFINQETPFGGDVKPISGYPLFNTPDQVGYDLMELGFDIIGIANNHMLDSYASGYQRTIDFWKAQEDVLAIGGYENEEDFENIRVIEKNGIKIAFLAYTYGTNGLSLPKNSELVIPLYDDETIDRQTKAARKIADCVIVSVHWGTEDSFTPNADQKRKAQIMVNNGVDVIIGHHPHVLQPMKEVERPDGGKTLIMYSLGNFLSGMMYSRNMVGGFLGFDIIKAPNGTTVGNAYFIPTMCHYNSSVRGFKIYRFSEYTEELEEKHGAHKFDSSMSMSSMRRIIENAIPEQYLIEEFYSK